MWQGSWFVFVSAITILTLTFRHPLAKLSYEFGSVRVFFHLQNKISDLAHQFFMIFCMKLDNPKLRKVSKCNFWKEVLMCQEGPKMKFWRLWKKSDIFIFLTEHEVLIAF